MIDPKKVEEAKQRLAKKRKLKRKLSLLPNWLKWFIIKRVFKQK